jgi:hypothetical protein
MSLKGFQVGEILKEVLVFLPMMSLMEENFNFALVSSNFNHLLL